ncbi:MAG: hypothetical protein HOP11_10400 [Saprospiraceae bacterium]|nr:hypothetical protein [Saprospiraceae bacterium]
MKKQLFLTLIACFFTVASLTSQEQDSKTQTGTANFGVDLLAGSLFFKEEPKTATVIGTNIWFKIRCLENRRLRPWCIIFETDIWWRPRMNDPWRKIFPINVFPPRPPVGPWDKFNIEDLELGNALVFSPSIGLQFGGERFKGSIYGGGGFQYTSGNESTMNGEKFRTTGRTAPLLTYGVSGRYFLKNNISVRAQVGAMRIFESDFNIIGPDGSVGLFEGMASTVPMVALGIGVGLN